MMKYNYYYIFIILTMKCNGDISAVCYWKNITTTHSLSGVFMPAYTTLKGCQDACYRDPTCFANGFDFPSVGTSGTGCWFSQSSAQDSYKGWDHYYWYCGAYEIIYLVVIHHYNLKV